ncbi:solute carrier family 35 member C2 isoform X2 [Bactrocera oleae]|uniref:solute carrier family 35 member C2 isoform X2 n=1 Tax=Bactrocera oleae TaxID=104688 RepID=UPI0006B789F5|nr:solute carrier family 35 member C2 [Bactrocera oleae]
MTQPRYELLSSGSKQDDVNQSGLSRRTTFGPHYDEEDDENEEIELSTEHRIRYESDDEEEDCYINGHLAGNTVNRDNVHNESGGVAGSPNTDLLPGSRLLQMAVGTVILILIYLVLSIGLIFYQQKLIKKLQFPMTIVAYHLVLKFLLSAIVRTIYKLCVGKTRVKLDLHTAWQKMAPAGIASGIDIGFSNWGLGLVPISLYTMTKSSTIVFILIFAIMLGLEKKNSFLIFIVGLIATGLFMFTYESADFNTLGFIFLLLASLSSGIRWSFAQFVMQKSKLGLHNPIDMIYYMQPWMIASVLPFLITFEANKLYNIDLYKLSNDEIIRNVFYITFGAVLAFLMECSEYLVLSKTSGLTLSIAGIFKDICQLALGVELNGDQLSLINVLGLVVCLAGICMHLLHKYLTLTKIESLEMGEEEGELRFNETSISSTANSNNHQTSGNAGPGGNVLSTVLQKKHSSQTIPLLEQSDSDDSNNDNERSASDVIFDVLKRRDMQR